MNIWTKLAMFSFFETERLYLRPFFFSDSQAFFDIASNPENLQFIFPSQSSLEESQWNVMRWIKDPIDSEILKSYLSSVGTVATDSRGKQVVLFKNQWNLNSFVEKYPKIELVDFLID